MIKKKIIGEVIIDGNKKYIYSINDSKLLELCVIKVYYMTNEGQKMKSFVTPDKIKKY